MDTHGNEGRMRIDVGYGEMSPLKFRRDETSRGGNGTILVVQGAVKGVVGGLCEVLEQDSE